MNKLCVHTSGSMPLSILKEKFVDSAVFYPVQSFNKNMKYDWSSIPICIEGSSNKIKNIVSQVAKQLSNKVINLNSIKRRDLHLAAVFANNFSNACFQMSAEILANAGIPFSILQPLILSTANKVQKSEPYLVQTGPAKRHDDKVMKLQLELLKSNKELAKIYKLISAYIQKEI
jgi:predicted short-subunit dehydrogenase-like oxidoreductase (DUF2520 family)